MTVVAAAPLTSIAVAPETFLTSTSLRATTTSADALTERALTAALLVRSKTTLLSVMFEVEQIKHGPEKLSVGANVKRWENIFPIITSRVKETPTAVLITAGSVPPKIILVRGISGSELRLTELALAAASAKPASSVKFQSAASADWTWLSASTPPKTSVPPSASLLFVIE